VRSEPLHDNNRKFLHIPFANKGVDAINISNILNRKEVEDNRKLNRFEIESDEQCEQWLLPEAIAIDSRSIQSEHKAVSN
jgi:hypothetical protein